MLDRAGYDGDPGARLLDPACGSGTFLVESISRLKEKCEQAGMSPLETLETVLSNVKGIDLNPLAVISARANYILSIYDLVFDLGHDIELPVYLADSINVPELKKDLAGNQYLEYTLDTEVKSFVLEMPWEFVESQVLGKVLLACENSLERSQEFDRLLQSLRTDPDIAPHLSESAVSGLQSSSKSSNRSKRKTGTGYGAAFSRITSAPAAFRSSTTSWETLRGSAGVASPRRTGPR